MSFFDNYHCCTVAQSCQILCDSMDCSMPGFPVLHHLSELAQTLVHSVSDAIQPLCPLSSPSPAFYLSSIRVCSNELALHIRWPKYWSFSFSINPPNEYSWLISFMIDSFDLQAIQGTPKTILQHHNWKHQFFSISLLYDNSHIHMWLLEKIIALTIRTSISKVYVSAF